jgi:hypothetical protein
VFEERQEELGKFGGKKFEVGKSVRKRESIWIALYVAQTILVALRLGQMSCCTLFPYLCRQTHALVYRYTPCAEALCLEQKSRGCTTWIHATGPQHCLTDEEDLRNFVVLLTAIFGTDPVFGLLQFALDFRVFWLQ